MARQQLPLEYARAVNRAWYARFGGDRYSALGGYRLATGRRRYVVTVVKRFDQPRAWPAYRKNRSRVHLPHRALYISRGGVVLGSKLQFWCGQSTHHVEFRAVRPREDLCRLCVARRSVSLTVGAP